MASSFRLFLRQRPILAATAAASFAAASFAALSTRSIFSSSSSSPSTGVRQKENKSPNLAGTSRGRGDRLGLFLNSTAHDQVKEYFSLRYKFPRDHRRAAALLSPGLSDRLRKYSGCQITFSIKRYVDDGTQQVLEMTLAEPYRLGFHDDSDSNGVEEEIRSTSTVATAPEGPTDRNVAQERVYVVFSSNTNDQNVGVEQDMLRANQAFAHADSVLGAAAESTEVWQGEIDVGDTKRPFQYVSKVGPGLELEATLATGQLWDPVLETARCECIGLRPRKTAECSFCKAMKSGPCSFHFQEWENCMEATGDKRNDCSTTTRAMADCTGRRQDVYGWLRTMKADMDAEDAAAGEDERSK